MSMVYLAGPHDGDQTWKVEAAKRLSSHCLLFDPIAAFCASKDGLISDDDADSMVALNKLAIQRSAIILARMEHGPMVGTICDVFLGLHGEGKQVVIFCNDVDKMAAIANSVMFRNATFAYTLPDAAQEVIALL